MPPSRRRGAAPDPEVLAGLHGSGLPRAERGDPLLAPPAVTPGSSPQQRALDAAVDRGLVESPVAPGTVTSAVGPAPAVGAGREKSTFYDTPAGLARARAAYLHTHVAEGERSWAEFVAGAVRDRVAQREARYNGGRSWAPVASGELPTGRPLGS